MFLSETGVFRVKNRIGKMKEILSIEERFMLPFLKKC
jgi:predicted transcriptional regulator YheO